jgi:hypothetical protein
VTLEVLPGAPAAERIAEFLVVNPDVPVLGLREGSTLRVEGSSVTPTIIVPPGVPPVRIFVPQPGVPRWDQDPRIFILGPDAVDTCPCCLRSRNAYITF